MKNSKNSCCTLKVTSILFLIFGLIIIGIGIGGPFWIDYKLKQGIIENILVDSKDSPG